MSIWADIHKRSNGNLIRKEDQLRIYSADKTSLSEEEKFDIENLLRALYDAPDWHNDILDLSPGIGAMVDLSDEKKSYLHLFVERELLPDKNDDRYEEIVNEIKKVRVLGEYKNGTIILYISNIKDVAAEESAPELNGLPYLTVTRYVYLHELMHAYFARKGNDGYEYNREKEEAFAEFGALLLIDRLIKTNHREVNHASKEEMEWAIRHVEGKKGVLECYSRGAVLFKQFGHDKELSKRMLEAYPKVLE